MARKNKTIREIARDIKLLVLDVDGVLTDGSIILDSNNNEIKAFHVRDGHGIKMLQKAGVEVAIITGRESKVVEIRAQELGITELFQGRNEKTLALEGLKEKFGLSNNEIAYIGDDVVDIPVLRRVGLPAVVKDADNEAKRVAGLITKNCGGRGAVREVCDLILKSKGLWKSIMREYLES